MKPMPGGTRLILLLGLLTMLGPLSIDMYLPGLAAIGLDLGVPTAAVELTLAAYFAGLASGQLISGPLLDRFGRRTPVLCGLALFVAGCAACGLAPTLGTLALARFLQALGGSIAMIAPRTIIRDLHVGASAANMMSRLMLVMGIAPILAPVLGGFLLRAGWRFIFAFIGGMGCLALTAAVVGLPDTRPEGAAPERWHHALGSLVRERGFVTYGLAGGFAQAGLFAYITGASYVIVTVHHVSAQRFGFYFGTNALGLIAASQVNRLLLRRMSPRAVLGKTLAFIAVSGLGGLMVAATGAGGLWGQLLSLFLFIGPLGCVMPNAMILALERHGTRAGVASAALGSGQFLIAALASTVVSRAHDGSAVPMAGVMALGGVLALVVFGLTPRGDEG